jgi:hypothetical protein
MQTIDLFKQHRNKVGKTFNVEEEPSCIIIIFINLLRKDTQH